MLSRATSVVSDLVADWMVQTPKVSVVSIAGPVRVKRRFVPLLRAETSRSGTVGWPQHGETISTECLAPPGLYSGLAWPRASA